MTQATGRVENEMRISCAGMIPESEVNITYEQCILDMQLIVYQFVLEKGGWESLNEIAFEHFLYEEIDNYFEQVTPNHFDAEIVLPRVGHLISERNEALYDSILGYIIMNFTPQEYADRWSTSFYGGENVSTFYSDSSEDEEFERSGITDDFEIVTNPSQPISIPIPRACECGRYYCLPMEDRCASCNGYY